MMIFWMLIALMLLGAMLLVAVPLWRGRVTSNTVVRDAANLEIFRDQAAEMERDLRGGLLTQEAYDQGKQELQVRLLDEVQQEKLADRARKGNPFRALAIVLMLLVPLFTVAIYAKVGNRHAILQQEEAAAGNEHIVTTAAELETLESQVDHNPEDAENLYKLARSYAEMERYEDAARAYDKLTQLVPNEAQVWADYADALAMGSGRSLAGNPTKYLNKALSLDPDNFKALALSGSAAMERGDYAVTVQHWQRLLRLIPPENENARVIEAGIERARNMLAQNGPAKTMQAPRQAAAQAGKETITGTVSLSAALKSHAAPDDTVFVLVRAAAGPKMPLAIVRKQVRDLPLQFALDDSMAMSPQMKLSGFEQVVVVARVSKSGNAMTQPGDMQGMSSVIKPGKKGLKLLIDQMAP